MEATAYNDRAFRAKSLLKRIKRNKYIYLLLFPSIFLNIFFKYIPIAGIKMAFQDYNIYSPEKSTWIGLENFKAIFNDAECIRAIVNTFRLSILNLVIVFPITIIFALLLNELTNIKFKRTVQTISYLPHFLSMISVIGIATTMLSKAGPINDLLQFLNPNYERRMFLSEQGVFEPLLIIIGLWKGLGWESIIFLAAITGVDTSLYEAVDIDGGGYFKKLWYVTLPSIMPTIVIMFLWKISALFTSNFELVYGLQNAFVDYEVIQTYVYKNGIAGGNYQLTTAFGLAQGLVNFTLLFVANQIAKKTTDVSLF